MQPPPTHSQPHRFGRFVAYRRSETDEQCTGAIHRAPRPKAVAQEIEALHRVAAASVIILAVDDFGLLRMKLQFASRKPGIKLCPKLLGLRLALAMANDIVGVTLK
jgi:hypothetical protein